MHGTAFFRRVLPRAAWLLLAVLWLPQVSAPQRPAAPLLAGPVPAATTTTAPRVTLRYNVEWRLVNAGSAVLQWTPQSGNMAASAGEASLHLESTGLVSKLYKVNTDYKATYEDKYCAAVTFLQANEGKRRRETRVTFDRQQGRASYHERDLVKDAVVNAKEIEVPACVHDVIGGLMRLRTLPLEPGQYIQLPISDGKKSVSARIEVQERETVKTPSGSYKAIRYEVFLFDNVLYSRKGRLFVWLTDDERRLPVQIRIRLQFYIGTITLQLEKEERS